MIDINNFEIGDRIKLVYTDDPYTQLKTGDKGTIEFINQIQISINWDNGSNLSMLPDKDTIELIHTDECINYNMQYEHDTKGECICHD